MFNKARRSVRPTTSGRNSIGLCVRLSQPIDDPGEEPTTAEVLAAISECRRHIEK